MDLSAFILIGLLPVTSYIPDKKQTDGTPYRTSINHRVNPYGVAVSPDLLASGKACYGDVLFIDGFGPRMVNDVMNARHKRRVDIFVETKDEERLVQQQMRNVYVMHSPLRACTREGAMKMAMVNAKKLRNGIEAFKKQNGRDPSYEELRDNIIRGAGVSRTPRNIKKQDAADGGSQGRTGH